MVMDRVRESGNEWGAVMGACKKGVVLTVVKFSVRGSLKSFTRVVVKTLQQSACWIWGGKGEIEGTEDSHSCPSGSQLSQSS